MKSIIFFVAALPLFLAGCVDEALSVAPLTRPAKLKVIGNSITSHELVVKLGWNHVSGMAASDAAHDFAHLVAEGLSLKAVDIENFAQLERNPKDNLEGIPSRTSQIDKHTAVIIELGDNVIRGGSPEFSDAYDLLLKSASERQSLICLSTWWFDEAKDKIIEAACTRHHGLFLFIGDIYPARKDVIAPGEDQGVANHPHDQSMQAIADRILKQFAKQPQ